MAKLRHPALWWALASAVAAGVGAFAPWATIDVPDLPDVPLLGEPRVPVDESRTGIERGSDGELVLAGAVVSLVLLALWASLHRPLRALPLLAGVVGAGCAAMALLDAQDFKDESVLISGLEQTGKLEIAWGVYLVAAAGASLLVASVVLTATAGRRRPPTAREAVPPPVAAGAPPTTAGAAPPPTAVRPRPPQAPGPGP